jgi:large subunit ribosomal protein L25
MNLAEAVPLEGQLRVDTGKGPARRTRMVGQIPAIVYATKNDAALSISVPSKDLMVQVNKNAIRKTIFALNIDGKTVRIIAKDLQLHPVKNTPIHVDFIRLEGDTMISIDVPVVLTDMDKAPVIKRGGKLQVTTRRVRLRVPATNIPDQLTYSLAGIDLSLIHI